MGNDGGAQGGQDTKHLHRFYQRVDRPFESATAGKTWIRSREDHNDLRAWRKHCRGKRSPSKFPASCKGGRSYSARRTARSVKSSVCFKPSRKLSRSSRHLEISPAGSIPVCRAASVRIR